MSANTPERLTPYRTPSYLERLLDLPPDQERVCSCNPESHDTSSPAIHLRPCVHQDARPFAWLDMSSASVSRPLRVNVRMRPTDVLPPMLQRTSTHCLAGSGPVRRGHPRRRSRGMVGSRRPSRCGGPSNPLSRAFSSRKRGRTSRPTGTLSPRALTPCAFTQKTEDPEPRSSRPSPT